MAIDPNKIFSKRALMKLRSPERLDMMLPVTTPLTWMGLSAVCVLLVSVIIWSIFGAFTVRADGMGLIMDSAGVVNIYHVANGKIDEIYVQPGDEIHEGELIAYVSQAEQAADARIAQYGTELATSDRDAIAKVYQYEAKRYQLSVAEHIYSEYDGIIDQVFVGKGSPVAPGVPILSVRLTQHQDTLSGLFYTPVEKGKRIQPGQTIQLAPNGADVQEAGSLLGVVTAVSQYPMSTEALTHHLGNSQLVQWMIQAMGSSVMEVSFDLVKDENDPSGYLWTSKVGEHRPITAGSFVTGSVIIERRPPIEKVFYKLSQALRSR